MKESFDQQAAHRPWSPTGSRQAGQSGGSATSTAWRNAARSAAPRRAKRAKRPVRASPVVISPCMARKLTPLCARLNVLIIAAECCR